MAPPERPIGRPIAWVVGLALKGSPLTPLGIPCVCTCYSEYWSGLPFPSPEDLPDPGIEPTCFATPSLAGRCFTLSHLGSHLVYLLYRLHREECISNCSFSQLSCPPLSFPVVATPACLDRSVSFSSLSGSAFGGYLPCP